MSESCQREKMFAKKLNPEKKDEKAFKKIKKKLAKIILTALLAFFDAVGPVWNFLCVKTLNPEENIERNNEIS